jgi:hypothetical protein
MTELAPGARPEELVPGRPDEVERLAARLARFATSSGEAAARLDSIDERTWSGEAGQLFREAVGPVPARLTTAAGAFTAAARALTAYAAVLKEGQAAAARAVRLVEQSMPDSAEADRQIAVAWLARARTRVEEAGQAAAMRLGEATADAPAGELGGRALTPDGVTVRLVTRHELTDPDHYVSPPGDWAESVADVRYTEPHEVGFADLGAGGSAHTAVPAAHTLPVPDEGATAGAAHAGVPGAGPEQADAAGGTGAAAWQAWAGESSGRALGVVEPAQLAAFGVAALGGMTVIGRRRREKTAMALVNLDELTLRARRDELAGTGVRGGMLGRARAGRLRGAGAWRTRLASPPRASGTVQHWTGPVGGPEPRLRVAGEPLGSVDRDVKGAVLRTGRPGREG